MRRLLFITLFAVGSSCGDSAPDNIKTCNDWVTAVKCGSVDLSDTFPCSTYGISDCDLSPYFSCLTMHYVCVNGMYDSAKISTANECLSLANCQ